MSSIDRVEVQRGAGSTLYGSGAIGGVVNVITAKPEEGVQTKLRVMGGSNDLEQYAITNEGSKNDWYWRVGLQKILSAPIKMVMACAFLNTVTAILHPSWWAIKSMIRTM